MDEIIAKFKEWIFYTRYAGFHFKNLISNELIFKLKSIAFPVDAFCETKHIAKFQKHLVRCIAQGILDKLTKKYFEIGAHIILAISLAPFQQLISPRILFSNGFLKALLPRYLSEVAKEKYKDKGTEAKKLQNNIKNLYAVLIDTTWYNWFPEIAKCREEARFSDGCENCYGVIYNTNSSNEIRDCNSDKIFDRCINPACVTYMNLTL